jgi:hypothetical protein
MALVLTLNLGDRFHVAGFGFTLLSIASYTEVAITRDSDGKIFYLSDRRSEEIHPDVWVAVGARGQMSTARLVVEAPRSIKIVPPSKTATNIALTRSPI